MPKPRLALSLAYDLSNNCTGFTLTQGGATVQSVSYAYDSLDRLTTVTSGGADQAVYTYDTNGNRASLTYPGGVKTTYTYNKANWVTGVSTARSGAVLWSGSYTYYASGNQASKTEDGVTTSCTYDPLGRLTKESQSGGQTLQYTYNAHGDRTSLTAGGTESYTVAYTYDAGGHLTEETREQNESIVVTDYAYDENGNLLSLINDDYLAFYDYDHLDRLIGVSTEDEYITYTYNAQGLRTSKTMGDVRTNFLLDGGNVVAEQKGTAITAIYLRGINLISRKSTAATQYYLQNAHGDVVALTGTAGAVQKRYTYDAFGNEASPSSSDANPFRYCGEYFDKETGSYYLRARYYDPTVGRFTQQDTHWNTANMIYGDNPQKINQRQDALGLTTYTTVPQLSAILQSGNLYIYCINNPVHFYDSTGSLASEIMGGGMLVAGAVSQFDSPLPGPADIVALGILRSTAILAGAAWIWENFSGEIQQFGRGFSGLFMSRSDRVNWDIDKRRQHHILHGSYHRHERSWRKLGIDPNDPNSFIPLLPFLKEAVDKGKEVIEQTRTGEIIIKYTYYFVDKAFNMIVIVHESNGVRVLSDAYEKFPK